MYTLYLYAFYFRHCLKQKNCIVSLEAVENDWKWVLLRPYPQIYVASVVRRFTVFSWQVEEIFRSVSIVSQFQRLQVVQQSSWLFFIHLSPSSNG